MVDYDTLKQLVEQGLSQRQIGEKLGTTQTPVRHWLAKHGLSTKRSSGPESVDNVRSISSGKNGKKCVYCGGDLSAQQKKYCSSDCQADQEFTEKLIDGNPPANISPRSLRRWLLKQRGHRCEECGLEKWQGEDIPLEMHHIDGDAKNNHFDNVQLVCPNCHALTDTYKARNTGNGRHYRRVRYKNGKSY
jgi:predicted transcriptional regulator